MPESAAVPAARPTPSDPATLSAEDGKLVVLARGARGRV
ncbi:cytidine deaminase, partial [Micromonospora sp. KC606]